MELLEALVVLFLCAGARLGGPPAPVLGGVTLGFIPGLPQVPLDPGLIPFIVLPPVLYQGALFTSWRDFRRHFRAISSLSIGLVLATTLAVAVTVHFLIPTLPWAAAFALGAIISPPDAVAATAVLSRFKLSKRVVTILEGESLVNDASGLVLYKFAVAAAVTGTFSVLEAAGGFVYMAAAGIGLSYAMGRAFIAIHKRLTGTRRPRSCCPLCCPTLLTCSPRRCTSLGSLRSSPPAWCAGRGAGCSPANPLRGDQSGAQARSR